MWEFEGGKDGELIKFRGKREERLIVIEGTTLDDA